MDLKKEIEQLNEVIATHEANIKTLKEQITEAKRKRRKFLTLEIKAKDIIDGEYVYTEQEILEKLKL